MRSEFENWFLSTPTGKALCTPNLGYYIFERKFDEYFDRDVEMAHRAWQHQQSKIDELTLQVAEMKSRLNDAYTDGQSAMYAARQSKVDELQKRVDEQGLIIAKVMSIASDLQKNWEMFEIGKKLEQALKGGSND